MCILSGIAVSTALASQIKYLDAPKHGSQTPGDKKAKKGEAVVPFRSEVALSARGHDGSRIIFDDFREAYYWLRMNTPDVNFNKL